MILRGLIVDITLVILMFSEMHVFSQGCFFSVFFGNVEGRNEVRGKSKELKTMEILVRNEELWYPIFFRAYPLFEKV